MTARALRTCSARDTIACGSLAIDRVVVNGAQLCAFQMRQADLYEPRLSRTQRVQSRGPSLFQRWSRLKDNVTPAPQTRKAQERERDRETKREREREKKKEKKQKKRERETKREREKEKERQSCKNKRTSFTEKEAIQGRMTD